MTCSSAVVISRCIKSIEKLLSQTHPDRDADISFELTIIKVELDKELATRIHAGKEVQLFPVGDEGCFNWQWLINSFFFRGFTPY